MNHSVMFVLSFLQVDSRKRAIRTANASSEQCRYLAVVLMCPFVGQDHVLIKLVTKLLLVFVFAGNFSATIQASLEEVCLETDE